MTTLRQAAQQALDALAGYRREMDLIRGESYMHGQPCDAEIALRAALEQDESEGSVCIRCGALAFDPLVPQQAEPVEPVAWMCPDDPERETAFSWKAGHCENCGKQHIPLYTAPPQRKPLTDDEILEMVRAAPALGSAEDEWLHVARAIERAHGIGEEE